MIKRFILLLLTLTLTMMITVACSNKDEENDTQNNVEEPPQTVEDENDVDNGNSKENENDIDKAQNNVENLNEEDENNDSSSPSQEVSENKPLPEPIEINEKIQHPNGVTFTLEKITFNDDYIIVDIEVLNGRQRPIRLAEYLKEEEEIHKEGAILVDDTGYEYRFIAPEGDEPRIGVGANEKMTASITFIGQLSEDATTLSLTFNPENSEDDPNTDYPKFEFKDIKIEW